MENKKQVPATQQPLTQQHLMAQHVHPDQIYQQQMSAHLTSAQAGQLQPNGVMHQLLQSQYQSNLNARSPLLENRHDVYGTGHNHDYARHYGANDNYKYPQSPPRAERTELHTDHNVNHELLKNIPVGYNAEVYQDYLKRNPPKDTNQYQNHQATYRPNFNQYGSKPYLPYSSRIGPQSNTELLRRQYTEIQQMKLQQQMHYQNQAQMHQQQKFAERQLLLQQIHGVQPPPNLQNSIYSDSSYRDIDRYSSKEFSPETPKDNYAKNIDYREMENQNRQYQEQWNNQADIREQDYRRPEGSHEKSQSPPSDSAYNNQKNSMVSPMKSSESSTPSVKSPTSDSRRSSSGTRVLRSPIAQRISSAPVAMSGILYKQGSDGLKVWRKRWFVLSEYCLFYYKSQDEEKLLGSVLLPSYKVSACTAEDKVLRKYSFKLEHANMRTYILAAPEPDAMLKWVKALTMAALMQSTNEQTQSQGERTAAKTELQDGEDIPTYANAPPKPRRSNEGYNSPSPDMYDPNYDLLKKPGSTYSQTNKYDHGNYSASPNMEYSRSPQSPPQTQYKRPYDTQHLSLPLTNENQPSTTYTNAQPAYVDRSTRNQDPKQDIYERQPQRNPFVQDDDQTKEDVQKNHDRNNVHKMNHDHEQNADINAYNRDVYGELSARPSRAGSTVNERLINERRTPDAYGRSQTMAPYQKGKMGDYEDVYGSYATENEYGRYAKSPNPSQARDAISISSQNHQQPQENPVNYPQEKQFTGPAVLRRKKMQASGIQPPIPRPHSADFLEFESKNENLNKTVPAQSVYEPPKQPQRPKSSLDINSYYDPSSDRYYSEESYAEKMRQSAQYLQQKGNLGPRTMDIPLAKYASGLAQKQLSSAYSQISNNNYETEYNSRNKDNVSYTSKYGDLEGLNSNWTLKEKGENQKDYLNRSGSVMSDGSNVSGFVKDMSKFDPSSDGFMRSASARLPSANTGEGERKVQQREESMKRLLEWKQRMLQSPLTRKSTPATISLARSLNQSRQSLRSDQYKPKIYANQTYNSYSSDDEREASMTLAANNTEPGTNNNANNQQALSKKAFLGSNTSIGRNTNRDGNIPVRAVSPRVRWVEDKTPNDHYGSQNMSASQQNINGMLATEDSWARSPSRVSQQPIRAVSPRVRRNTENDEMQRPLQNQAELTDIPTAGELLGRTHEELVLLLIQLRRRHTATSRAIEQCCSQIESIEECRNSSIKAMEREEHLQRLEQLKMQLMELEQQYEKSKPLVQLVDNMVKLGSLYNRPGSTVERLERNQRLRQKVLAEHALEQQRWLESVASGKPLETEAARARVAELWALEQELADEASILQGLKTDKDTIESMLTGVRGKLATVHKTDLLTDQRRQPSSAGLEAELARVHAMLAHNSKKLEQTVADNARLERELQQLRRALQARRAAAPAHPTAMLEDEVSRVQQLVSALQRQRQELSRAVRHLTQQSHVLQSTHDSMPGKQQHRSHSHPAQQQRPLSSWSETNLDTGHTIDHGYSDYEYDNRPLTTPAHYQAGIDVPLYVDTRAPGDVISPLTSEDVQNAGFANLSNVEKQEIKTVRIVKRESERRQRDRERSLQPLSDWPSNTITTNLDQFIEDELVQSFNNTRASSLPRTDYYKNPHNPPNYLQIGEKTMELSPKYVSSPSLSYDYSQNMSSLNSSYNKSYNPSGYDRMSLSAQYMNSPTESTRTLTNDPMSISKTSSIVSLTRSNMELSPIFKSEAAKQIITEMSGEPKNGSLHRRQVPKEKRRHYTAPHHLSAKTLNELPKDAYSQEKLGRSLDDADMERALRTAPAPDVVRSALPPQMHKLADNTIDQLLAAPQKILIPERYIPEKPPELSPEEQQKRQEKVESIKKMLTGTPADQSKSPDAGEKRQREHLLQMNQILAKQVTEMSKIIAGTNTEGPRPADH